MSCRRICLTIFALFPLATFCIAGDSLDDNRRALEKVKSEIAALKKDLVRTNLKSSSTLEQISTLEKEISLVGKSRRLLQKKNRLLNKQISGTKNELDLTRRKLDKFKKEHAQRVVYSYKNRGTRDLEVLLTSRSFNQALSRVKYLNMFATQEKRLIEKIHTEIEKIDRLKQDLQADQKELSASLQEKENEELSYLSKKDQKKLLVSRLRWTERNLQKRLTDAKTEYQKLYQLILALERQRRERGKEGERKIDFVLNYKNFSKNKGKLPWPVKGDILHAYGSQHDAKLKTTINNTGIDIKASTGSKVHAIFTGEVSMITYLSGFGNTIILHHGQGYYTVYSHLEDVLVELDDIVEANEVIALVGDSGSLEGSKLHFALFSNQKTENPQKWLR